jgi:hypothetical protein
MFGCSTSSQTKIDSIPVGSDQTFEGSNWSMITQDCWSTNDCYSDDKSGCKSWYIEPTKQITFYIIEGSDVGEYITSKSDRKDMLTQNFQDNDKREYSDVTSDSSTMMHGSYTTKDKSKAGKEYEFWSGNIIVSIDCVATSQEALDANQDQINKVFQSIHVRTPNSSSSSSSTGQYISPKTNNPSAISEGSYRIGKDIPSGEYRVKPNSATSKAYYAVYESPAKSEILINDSFHGQSYFDVQDGEFLQISGASFSARDDSKITIQNHVGEGTYIVGVDIPAGEYTLAQTSGTKAYAVNYDSMSKNRSIITNDSFTGTSYMTVSNGSYLQLDDCTASL